MRILMMPDFRKFNHYQTLLAKALESQGVTVKFWPYYLKTFPVLRAAVLNKAVIKDKEAFDIVHLHWIHPYIQGDNWLNYFLSSVKFIVDILITKLTGIRVVWTIHNYVSHEAKFPELELWTKKQVSLLVDRIILHQKLTLEWIAKDYGFDIAKAEVIPNGHYREIYSSPVDSTEARKELGLPLTGRIYLNIGNLKPYKGVEDLLKVWKQYRAIFHEDTLLIAGEPINETYSQNLKQWISAIDGVVLYPEFIEDQRIHLFLSAADVVVLPFKQILNSGSVVLAMSYGKPIIAPRLGGISETLGVADSLLYNPEDEQGLFRTLEKSRTINLEKLSQLVTKACDQLDWSKIAEKTLQVYQIATNYQTREDTSEI